LWFVNLSTYDILYIMSFNFYIHLFEHKTMQHLKVIS